MAGPEPTNPDPIYYLITPVATFFFFWILEVWKNAVAKREHDRKAINTIRMELFENKMHFARIERMNKTFQSQEQSFTVKLDLSFQTSHWGNLSGEIPLDEKGITLLIGAYSAMSICYGMSRQEGIEDPSHKKGQKQLEHLKLGVNDALAQSIKEMVLPAIDPALDALAEKKVALSKAGVLPYMVEIFSPKLASRIRRLEERDTSK